VSSREPFQRSRSFKEGSGAVGSSVAESLDSDSDGPGEDSEEVVVETEGACIGRNAESRGWISLCFFLLGLPSGDTRLSTLLLLEEGEEGEETDGALGVELAVLLILSMSGMACSRSPLASVKAR